MSTISIEVPEQVKQALNRTSEELGRDMRLYAALMLFQLGKLSSGMAAQMAGITRIEFVDRNILDEAMIESVKEISKLDGAFVIKGNGVIISAGTNLRPAIAAEQIPQGLGARHAAAAAITACTKSISISLSESTGTVRIWRRGLMITEIERSPRGVVPPPTRPAAD